RRQAHLQPGRRPVSGYRRASAARISGLPLCSVLRDPGAAGGAPVRHCNLLSREPRHAPFRAHLMAGRSGRHPTASAAERRATDFYLLYDLGSAHEPGLAAGAFPVRARGRVTGALACILPADAASALRCPHRARAIRVPARRRSAGPALCLGKPRQRRSILMGTTPRLKTVIAAAALLTRFSGAASAFCGLYVAKADSKLFKSLPRSCSPARTTRPRSPWRAIIRASPRNSRW